MNACPGHEGIKSQRHHCMQENICQIYFRLTFPCPHPENKGRPGGGIGPEGAEEEAARFDPIEAQQRRKNNGNGERMEGISL